MGTESGLALLVKPAEADLIEPLCSNLNDCTLEVAIQQSMIDCQTDVPWIVWLVENPNSLISLPGKIDLYGHDCMHALIDRLGHSLDDEAFVIGFTMGNDDRTTWLHQFLFKLISSSLYPKKYRFFWKNFQSFDAGFRYGRSTPLHNLNRINFRNYRNHTVLQVKQQLGLLK